MTGVLARLTRAATPFGGQLGEDRPAVRARVAVAVALGLAQTATVVVQAVLLATIIERGLLQRAPVSSLRPQLIGLALALAGRGALGWGGEVIAQRTATAVAGASRRRLLDAVLALGPGWLAGERAGELALSATVGVDSLGLFVGRYLPQLVLAVLAPVAVLAWVGTTDWPSLLILLGLVALVPPSMIAFGRRAREATARQWRSFSSLAGHLLELVGGLPTLRVFGRVEVGRREVAEATERLRRSTLRTLRVVFLSSLCLELLAGLGVGLVAMVLGLRLLDGHVTLSVALAVLLVSPEVFLPLRRAAAEFHLSAEGRTAGERVAAVLAAAPRREPVGRPVTGPIGGTLSLEGVTVRFSDRPDEIGPITLTLEPGRRIALLGPSGSGKSTVLHAVLGLVPLSGGRILVGGRDLHDLDLAEWRRQVAWVPQRPHLFAGTIADNLRLARPDATGEELDLALAVAGLDAVVARMPLGLKTPVAERGVSLSAGERQRVAVARAVLHGGDLVLLDEVGAHLDEPARDRLRASLEPWLDGRSVLLASHRPDAVSGIEDAVVLGAVALGRAGGS